MYLSIYIDFSLYLTSPRSSEAPSCRWRGTCWLFYSRCPASVNERSLRVVRVFGSIVSNTQLIPEVHVTMSTVTI